MRPILLICSLLLLAACGDGASDALGGASERVMVDGAVIIEGDTAQVCYLVLESYPPQCGGGLTVESLDEDDVPDAEDAGGVTVGHARLTGDLDGGTLTVTEEPEPARGEAPADDDRPRRSLEPAEQAELEALFHDEVWPLLEEQPEGTWLDAELDEEGGYIRVTVVDEEGEFAEELRSEYGGDVDIRGWITYLE